MTTLTPPPRDDIADDISQHPEDCATDELVEYIRTNDHGNPRLGDAGPAAVLEELTRRHRCATPDQLTPLVMGHADDDDSALTPSQ